MTTGKVSAGRCAASPLCVRVTPEERQFLETRARESGQQSVSAFIRARLFGMVRAGGSNAVPDSRLSVFERQKLLAQILAAMGGSKAFGNLGDLAEAARIGVLPLTPEVVGEIRAACAAIIDFRNLLLRALGVRPTAVTSDDH